MNKNSGLLGLYDLWDFWDELSDSHKKSITDELAENKGMWDYKSLFNGTAYTNLKFGAIYVLDLLLVNDDLELCDKFYFKFCEYNAANYLTKSWGSSWQEELSRNIHTHKMLQKNRVGDELKELNETWNIYYTLKPNEVYWKDSHFFLSNFAQRVYRNFLKSNSSIERFYNTYLFEYDNSESIIKSINKLFGIEMVQSSRNKIFEQYLIYLEKKKNYSECISVANLLKNHGWKNDFNKRIERCSAKLAKHGNKS